MSTNVLEKPKVPVLAGEALCWLGALPATEPVEMINWTTRKNVGGRDYFDLIKADPWQCWEATAGIDEARQWVGKCRFFQNLDAGITFPAFSEILERQATNENEATATPYPGLITVLSRTQIQTAINKCYKTVVRFPQGVENRMKVQRNVQLVDLNCGQKPERMTDAEWRDYQLKNTVVPPTVFNPDTDMHVAHFVYLIELDKAPSKLVRDMKTDPSRWLPTAVQLLEHQRLTEAFFRNPPKSVADLYPLKDGK